MRPHGRLRPWRGPGGPPVARDLRWLQARGATIERYGLAQEPAAFAQSTRVAGLLQAIGETALPATLVNGEVLAHGRYPTRDERVAALSPAPSRGSTDPATDGACCEPGSGCERALLEEDLRSPCTEEIAVFRAFARTVAEADDAFVVLDTAPTGYTLLLLDAAESYHREVARTTGAHVPEAVRTLLPRLRDARWTKRRCR